MAHVQNLKDIKTIPEAYSEASADMVMQDLGTKLSCAAAELRSAVLMGRASDPVKTEIVAARLERIALDIVNTPHPQAHITLAHA